MIILLWLYPSHLLIAVECIFLQWSLVRYSDIVRMLLPAQFTFMARSVSVFPYHSAKASMYDFLPCKRLKEKFTYLFFVSIVPGKEVED